MKKHYLLLFLFFIAGFSYGQELLLNGNLESWDDATTPTSYSKAESVDQESVAANVNGGTYSAKHTGGTSDLTQAISGIIPGNSYTLTLWYKVDPGFGDGTDARIWSYWLNGTSTVTDAATDADLRGPNNAYFDNNGNVWTEYTVTMTAPAGVDGFRFEVRTYGSAVVYWDDFSFFAEAASSDPGLTITSPAEGSTELTGDTDIIFIVSNFDVQDGTGDGRIRYTVDGGSTILKSDTTPISLTGLSDGAHSVYMELVDNSNNVLSPEVNATVNFTTNNIIQTFPFYEPFDYTAGQTLGEQNIWTDNFSGDSPEIVVGSLNYSTLTGTGNSVNIVGVGADPTVDYTPTSSGTVYASFIFKVNAFDAAAVDGYFAILRADGGSYISRLWISPRTATTYSIGISNTGTLTQIDAQTLNLGDEVFVVFNYDLDGDMVNAWVNPSLGGAEPSADISEASGSSGNTLSQFMIRQDDPDETPDMTIDELRLGSSWADVASASLSVQRNEIEGFAVYPNPVSNGYLTIRSINNSEKVIQVFDIVGKQVFQRSVRGNERIDVSSISKGMYILKVEQDGNIATRKLIIE